MAHVPVYNDKGKAVGEAPIAERIVECGPHPQAVHDYVVAVQANQRHWAAHTRDRSLVSGSNAKPWRQKGTGRARAGTLKSPLFRGGGTIQGPKPKPSSVRVNLPRKVRRLALEAALGEKVRDGKLVVLDKLELAEPRTRLMAGLLTVLKIEGKVLLVAEALSEAVRRASRNIPTLALKTAGNVNALDVLKARTVVVTKDSLGPMGLSGAGEGAA